MRGRKLYLRLAEASFENSLDLFRNAGILRTRGSRGHAYSLLVLCVEEGAKAYLYKLAGEGVYRIVAKKPNGISTYSESQLFDHKFKHTIIARLVHQGILLAPVRRVLAKTRRNQFARKEVEAMLSDLLHEQEMMKIQLRPGGKDASELLRVFEALGRANQRKNLGFYVGHEAGKIRRPNDCPKKTLDEGFELAGVVSGAVGAMLSVSLSQKQKRQASEALHELTAALKLASKKPVAHPTPSDSISGGSGPNDTA